MNLMTKVEAQSITGGQLIRFARLTRSYTQSAAAAQYGVDVKTLGRWENSASKVPYNDVNGLLSFYKMTLIDVLEKLSE